MPITQFQVFSISAILKQILLLSILMVGGTTQAANLISNGDFETNSLTDWNVSGNIDISSSSISGAYSIVFNGGNNPANGELSQSFATTIGKNYTLTFKYGRNGFDRNQQLTMQLDGVGGIGSLMDDIFDAQTNTIANPDTYSFIFTADSAITTLRFKDNATNNTASSDIIIDDISIPSNPPIAGFGTALDFDGTNDYVNCGDILPNYYTKEAWVKFSGTPDKNILSGTDIGSSTGNAFLVSSQKLSAGHNGTWNYVQDSEALQTGIWYHVAVTYSSSGEMKLYKNGILIDTQAGVPIANSNRINIGNYIAHYINGRIDEARIWNVARTQSQIQANIYKTLQGNESGLVGYWQLDEDTGITAIDKTSNTNDGLLTNMNTTTDWIISDILTFTTNQNTPFIFSNNLPASDTDGDTLTYSIVDSDGGAAVITDANTGAFTYTPNTSGTRTFTYKVNDGLDDSNIATVTISVTSLVVDNINDTEDGDYGSGQNTLREAIANASAGDTITFNPSIAGQTIILSNQLTINKDLTIDGTGQNITVSGNNAVRVFETSDGNIFTFDGLIIANAKSNQGGGIWAKGNVIVKNCTFISNIVTGNGGAIRLNNNASRTLFIENSTFINNSANRGGAIDNDWAGGTTIRNSTFFNNTTTSSGGTIRSNTSNLIIENSTFSDGNNNTINSFGSKTFTLKNSILANNTDGTVDCKNTATLSISTNNLIESNNGCGTPILTADPMLSSLTDNGGDTQTMALLPGSPAINAGDNTTCEATDQRRETRPKHTTCDIGAYEYELLAPTSLTANAISQTQINLAWVDNSSDETGFKIERDSSLITTTVADVLNYSDSSLSCGTTYNYSVTATNASVDSTAILANTTTQVCLPNDPTDLINNYASETQINLSWTDNSDNETGFIIERNGKLITTTDTNITSYSDSNLSCGNTYSYSIRATNISGDSSDISITTTTKECPEPTVTHNLIVTKIGNGTITTDYGINCGIDCEQDYADQSEISLIATPDIGWIFDNWTGDCDNNGIVQINKDKTCTATFLQQHTLNITVEGLGTVNNCGAGCIQTYLNGEIINLTTTSELATIWTGDCDENGIVIMDSNKTCIATFIDGYPVTINLIGKGTIKTVTKECKENCQEIIAANTTTSLIAEPEIEWILESFSGDCDTNGTVEMNSEKSCTANFIKDPNIPNNGDGNGDGIHDADQPNVVSIPDQNSGNYLTLDIGGNVTVREIYTDLAENQDYFEEKYIFPQGLVYFELEGTEADITIYYHSLQKLRTTPIFQKFGAKIPGDMNTLGWYVMPNVIFNTVEVGDKSVVTVSYHLTDGGLGDNTGIDGRIVDPGGIAFDR
ncbi:MAG: choice-of-anchor Q domain-containing protein [Candidatus Marithrix sp.]